MTVLHWFRDDLRLSDNPALNHASQSAKTAYVYILEEDEAGSVLGLSLIHISEPTRPY